MPLINQEMVGKLFFAEFRKTTMAKAQRILTESGQRSNYEIAEAWAIVGECHKLDLEPQLAEDAYLKALEVIRGLGNNKLLSEGYQALGDIWYYCKDYRRAVVFYQQALRIIDLLKEVDLLAQVLSQLAYSYAKLEQKEQERYYLNRGVAQLDIPSLVKATFLERIALSLNKDGRKNEAALAYEQALSIFKQEKFERNWQQRVQSLVQIYRELGNEEAAQKTQERLF